MRRTALLLAFLLTAVSAGAATPYFLDRQGVLWSGSSSKGGLVLTGQRNGQIIVQSTVPFALGFDVNQDVAIQVAADEPTGKVAVVWQRNWTSSASEIMLAVWHDGDWERIEHLSSDVLALPRNPVIQLTDVSTTVPDPDYPDDPSKATVVQDSFLNVVWWEGDDQQGHGTYASLRLTADPTDASALVEQDLDSFATIGFGCQVPVPPAVLEHPLFADQHDADRALVFFGAQRQCLFHLLQVRFELDTPAQPTSDGGGLTAVAQRRRHVPIFGLVKTFPMTRDLAMDGTRLIVGHDLVPVAYRVTGPTLQYVTFGKNGWSPLRTLSVTDGLTIDQAIPLVENLAR
jgi:hypothetical protein